jgi:hypothetical protein
MNRHQRRAEATQARRMSAHDRAAAVAEAMHYLARVAAPTATGATLMHPDGTSTYINAADARSLYGDTPARGRA